MKPIGRSNCCQKYNDIQRQETTATLFPHQVYVQLNSQSLFDLGLALLSQGDQHISTIALEHYLCQALLQNPLIMTFWSERSACAALAGQTKWPLFLVLFFSFFFLITSQNELR